MAGATTSLSGKSVVISKGAMTYNITGRFSGVHGGVYRLYAIGYAKINQTLGFHGVLSGYSFVGKTGMVGRDMTAPLPTLTASGTVTTLGEFIGLVPFPTLSASGTATALGSARLTLTNSYGLAGKGGAIVRGTLTTSPTLVAHGLGGFIGEFTGRAPVPTLLANGSVGNVGALDAELPALTRAPSGVLRLTFPRLTLYAVGGSGAAVTYEAYSVSLFDGDQGEQACVTHYTDYPFDRIVRFGAKYYGVATDGLFELTGDLFDDVPIVAVIRTGETDFKAREMKRPISMYVAGRVGGDFSVAVTPAEVKNYTYAYRPVNKTGARNYRVLFGKGMKARYLAYTFSNTRGEDFDIDELTPEVAVLRRTA